MAKVFNTELEKEILHSKNAKSMPLNPSQSGFNAEQIKKKLYDGEDYLLELLQETRSSLTASIESAAADRQEIKRRQDAGASKTYVDTKVSDLSTEFENKGYITEEALDGYATEDYVNENGGKIDKIYFNNEELPITPNKAVYIEQEPYDDSELVSQIEAVDERADATNQSLEALSESVDELNNNLGTLGTNVDFIDERLSEVEDDVIPTLADKQFVENLVNGKNRSVVISYAYSGNEFVTNNQVYKYVGGVFVNQSNPSDTKTPEVFFSDTLSLNLTVSKVYRVYQSASYPYSNVYELVDLTKLRLGDIIWIKETNVPDYWVSAVAFGNISLSKLETSKVDLTDYQSKITSTNKLSADLINENTNKSFVTSAEKATWNAKSNFSGDYNDLTNKPTIPTNISDLNDYWYVMSEINTAINASNVIQTITLNYDSVISVDPLTVLIDQETYTKAIDPTTHLMNIDASPIGLFTGVIYRYAVYEDGETIVPYFSFFRDFNGYDLVFAQIDIDTLEVDGETKYAMQLSITPITSSNSGSGAYELDLTQYITDANGDIYTGELPEEITQQVFSNSQVRLSLKMNGLKLFTTNFADFVSDDETTTTRIFSTIGINIESYDFDNIVSGTVSIDTSGNFYILLHNLNHLKEVDITNYMTYNESTGVFEADIQVDNYDDSEQEDGVTYVDSDTYYTLKDELGFKEIQLKFTYNGLSFYAKEYTSLYDGAMRIFSLTGVDVESAMDGDFTQITNGTCIVNTLGNNIGILLRLDYLNHNTYTKEEIDEKLGDIESLLEAI